MKKLYRQLLRDGYGIEEVDTWEVGFFFSVMAMDESQEINSATSIEDVF